MAKRFFTYIICALFSGLSMTACVNDEVTGEKGGGEMRDFEGTITFSLSMPDVMTRSRAVNMESGESILINNLWVGVFDTTTGNCFGAARYDDMNKLVQSGAIMKNMLSVDFVTRGEDLPLAYIVAVANYDGVTTWDGRNLADLLPDFDHRAGITWDDVINLDVNTQSAYAGSKGENEHSNAPFLAGFFQDAVSLTQNPKIDQFSYAALGPAAIYPATAAAGMDIQLGDANEDKIYVAAGAICLRRLVSHNTVHVNMSNGYEVTKLRYKRFNMPRAVFLLQRRTDTNRYTNFEDWQRRSPNFADHLLTEGDYETASPAFPYACDTDWISIDIDDPEQVEFAFDHFENKHWGVGDLKTQSDREARNEDGTFAALCSGRGDAYNDFASYFVLSMHVINKLTGESADVEYTLHEGYCNNDDGRIAESQAEKCRDFSSFRNVHYTYNINLSGLNDITAYVTSEEPAEHPNGQTGTIWKMNYATGPAKSPIPVGGGVFNFNDNYISFSDRPDLGFRIYGRDSNDKNVDICYNMPDGMYDGFAGLWPSGNPQFVSRLDNTAIPQSLLESMQIGAGSTYYTLTEFVDGVQKKSIDPTGKFSVRFAPYDDNFQSLTGNFMRGIYIFDRNDLHNAVDEDGCSGYHIAYGAEQYPFEPQKIKFDAGNILWDNSYYKFATSVANVFAAATNIFYGAECSIIDLRWKHDPRFVGYKISVYNDTYVHPTIVVGSGTIDRYLHDVKGEQVFIYPLSTADFPRSATTGANNYSFTVMPIVESDIYTVEGPTVVAHNATSDDNCIRVCPTIWETSTTTDWKNIMLAGLTGGIEIHYRGLGLFCTSDVGTQYNNKNFICFGGSGSINNRYFSFWASVPGKLSVTCVSHSSTAADAAARTLVIARLDEYGSQTDNRGERYDEIYDSGTMATSKTTYDIDIAPTDGKPTEFRIYARGSIDYYKFQFFPAD